MRLTRIILGLAWLLAGGRATLTTAAPVELQLDAGKTYQAIDGFGANINPDQWREGRLRPALRLLVRDLGGTLFRFDPVGQADWLNPARRNADGSYPAEYLAEVYTSPAFRDAWAAFRELNALGCQPLLNVSGRIPAALGRAEEPKRLADFAGYAEMVATMAQWAREREHLNFRLLSPFNETDFSFPEGPGLKVEDVAPAMEAMLQRLAAHGLGDLKLVLMDDGAARSGSIQAILEHPAWRGRLAAFGFHTYGNGNEGEAGNWYREPSAFARIMEDVQKTAYAGSHAWMTEYGDLDQTGAIEREIGWRSTRRLLKCLNEGFSAGLVWDAYDNFHKHDNAWSIYGLLATDTNRWTYQPKPRYYAARQVFAFVPPGFVRCAVDRAQPLAGQDPYAGWHDRTRHLLLTAFVAPNGEDFTLVGMNSLEGRTELKVTLSGLSPAALAKPVQYYRTGGKDQCALVKTCRISRGAAPAQFTVIVPEKTIFTLTTLKK